MADFPLAGIRVLSMEQAVALPFATRHLADLGAEVIRVQSHKRRSGPLIDIDLTRDKLQLGIDLATAGGPEAFLRVAAQCDIVAHNYTPRVVRQFGIDYDHVRAVRPDVIYVSITGFGTTGPWGERPLFGPGAEAVSGHNLLIGTEDGWPGRPGTVVYADTVCGLNAVFAILAAIDHREQTGEGQHIDVSLYETAISHLGPVMAERELGANPRRFGNADANYAIHGVFTCKGVDRHITIAARDDQLPAVATALGLAEVTEAQIAAAVRDRDRYEVVTELQSHGVAASVVADAADGIMDVHLWQRGYFGRVERHHPGLNGSFPHPGPAWGRGADASMHTAHAAGADSEVILRDIAAYSSAEIAVLLESGAAGAIEQTLGEGFDTVDPLRVVRGELSRIDAHDYWHTIAHDTWSRK